VSKWERSDHDVRTHYNRCIDVGPLSLKGVAFFMKQMTGKTPIPDDLLVREFP
jgi:hypothetical protein